jgi:hypothetical protein
MRLNAAAEEASGRELAHVLSVRLEEAHALTEVLGLRPLVAQCHHGLVRCMATSASGRRPCRPL